MEREAGVPKPPTEPLFVPYTDALEEIANGNGQSPYTADAGGGILGTAPQSAVLHFRRFMAPVTKSRSMCRVLLIASSNSSSVESRICSRRGHTQPKKPSNVRQPPYISYENTTNIWEVASAFFTMSNVLLNIFSIGTFVSIDFSGWINSLDSWANATMFQA